MAKKKVTKRKVSKKRTLTVVGYQTGKRKSIAADRARKASLPGRRRSESGKKYTETRRNRTDRKGSKL